MVKKPFIYPNKIYVSYKKNFVKFSRENIKNLAFAGSLPASP